VLSKRGMTVLVGLSLLLTVGTVKAQKVENGKADTTKTVVKPPAKNGEMVLEDINIQGRIDKPGVIIVPKRVEPELKEKELDRSFKKELREGVGEIGRPQKELRNVDNVKSIKKAIERKRK